MNLKTMNIYVLLLENNKYYIGKTDNPEKRVKEHFSGYGSAWTNKYKPVKLVETFESDSIVDEDKYTLEYMNKYGIDNVRGASYCQIELDDNTRKHLTSVLNNAKNRCLACGQICHFIKDCPLENLPFRDENLPSKEEYKKYLVYLDKKQLGDGTRLDISHLHSFFSKFSNNIEDYLPYMEAIFNGYKVYIDKISLVLNKK